MHLKALHAYHDRRTTIRRAKDERFLLADGGGIVADQASYRRSPPKAQGAPERRRPQFRRAVRV